MPSIKDVIDEDLCKSIRNDFMKERRNGAAQKSLGWITHRSSVLSWGLVWYMCVNERYWMKLSDNLNSWLHDEY